MRRIIAIILSAAVILGTLTAVTVFSDNQLLWKYIDGASNTVITANSSNIYTASRETGGFRIMTTQKFDPRQKKLSVVLGETTGDWFTFGVVGGDGSVASLGNTQNGLDFVIHDGTKNALWRVYLYRNSAVAASYGDHQIKDFSEAHTFGFNRQDGNWYLTIDGKIVNADIIHSEINRVLDNNDEVYFVVGAQGVASLSEIEIVDNDEFKAWLPLTGEPDISKNADATYNLSGSGEIISGDIYDVDRYELSFVSGATVKKPLRLGVAAENSDGDVIQKGVTAEINDGDCSIGFFGADGYFELPEIVSIVPNKAHTFSIKSRKGVFYPSIDGVIINFPEEQVWQNRLNEFNDFIQANGGKVKFTLFSESGLDLKNVSVLPQKTELVPHKSFAAENDYNGTVTVQNDNGLTLEGKSSFITSDTYDIESYDLSFKVTDASSWVNIAVTKSCDLEDIGQPLESFSDPATRVDFLVYVGDDSFCVNETGDGVSGYSKLFYNDKVKVLNSQHTFGLRKIDGHWYPAIDGAECTFGSGGLAISSRLDQFIDNNGSSSMRFAIGSDGSGSFKAENVGVVENSQSMFLNNNTNKMGSVVNQPNGSVTLSSVRSSDFFTVDAYDITKKDFVFTIGDLPKEGRIYLSLAKDTGSISKNLGNDFENPSRLDFQIIAGNNNNFVISFDATTGAKQSEFYGATNYLKNNLNNKTHSFGVRKINGKWYPAIDGFVYVENPHKEAERALNHITEFIEDNGTNFRFGIATNHEVNSFTVTDVNVADINKFAAHINAIGSVEFGENDYSVLTGERGTFLTTDPYNPSIYDLQFNLVSAPTEYIGLSVTKADLPANISTNFGSDFNNPSRIDFKIFPQYNQIVICFKSTDGSAPQAVFNAASLNLQRSLKSTAHTFGVRKVDGHWYPAIDGTAYTVTTKGSQNPTKILDDFMTANSEVRFGIGGQANFKIEAKVVEYNTLWGACSGGGTVNKEVDGVSSADDFYLSIRTVNAYDITNNDIQFKFTNYTGDWVRFGLAVANDSSSDQATDLGQTMGFISRFGRKEAFSYLINGTEKRITNIEYDLNTVHTFGVRELDGHWYPALDGYIINTKSNDDFDAFINENKENGLRFYVGAHNRFWVSELKIIDAVESVPMPLVGWDIYDGQGGGSFEGNDQDGYSRTQLKDSAFAFTNAKYDMRKTSLSFNCTDIGEYIYFAVSTGDAHVSGVLPVGEDPNRFIFILRPVASDKKIQVSYWNIDGVTAKERVVTTRNFNWFDRHTVDVRQLDENWFVCVDGIIYQSRISTVFNNFMNKHVDEGLHYGFGGVGTFSASEIKIINQVPLSQEAEGDFEDGTLDDEDVDWGFDFYDESLYDLDFDSMISGDFSFSDDGNLSFIDADGNADDNSLRVIGRVKKKKLVSAGHGYIFEWYEILGSILGGVILVGGIVVTTVVLLKRRKKAK